MAARNETMLNACDKTVNTIQEEVILMILNMMKLNITLSY
jgi:hypothetical protein